MGFKARICQAVVIKQFNITYLQKQMKYREPVTDSITTSLVKTSSNVKQDEYTLLNAEAQLDNGYWKLLQDEHLNHTGPLYSGPIKVLQYNPSARSFKLKTQNFRYWGLNFLDYQREDIKY